MSKRNSNKIMLLLLFLFGFNDLWLDKEKHITDNIILQYFNGDGYRLIGNSDNDISNTIVTEVYKNDSLILVKANPTSAFMDTIYYKIAYSKNDYTTHTSNISKKQFDSITIDLKDIIENLK